MRRAPLGGAPAYSGTPGGPLRPGAPVTDGATYRQAYHCRLATYAITMPEIRGSQVCAALSGNAKALALTGVTATAMGALPVGVIATGAALYTDWQARKCMKNHGML